MFPDLAKNKRTHRPVLQRYRTIEAFQAKTSIYKTLTEPQASGEAGVCPSALEVIYLGVAVAESKDNPGSLQIGISAHDGTYSINYTVKEFIINQSSASSSDVEHRASTPINDKSTNLTDFILKTVHTFREDHYFKCIGAGITQKVADLCPDLSSRLWKELDIVTLTLDVFKEYGSSQNPSTEYNVDEDSDAVVRKAIKYFGPNNQPRLDVQHPNEVNVDCGDKARIVTLEDLQGSVHKNTWEATMYFAQSLKANRIKIAFFNSTPQGGGVALMRHALIRFMRLMGVDCKWYVPRPKPEIFRITKNNHNILQGVDTTGATLTPESILKLDEWCHENADRYWTRYSRPLAPRARGGADIIVIDDPQMPMLVDIAKQLDPDRPVIFRSHIQVRADLANDDETPTSDVWNWVWNHVKKCDVFISHPVREFIPANVTPHKVGYMPATTDWLDGLNKPLSSWDTGYYMHEFFVECHKRGIPRLHYPNRRYIVQIARFDPAKGIPHVLESYAQLRRDPEYTGKWSHKHTPQLVIAGHGAIDDPDATTIYNQTIQAIDNKYPELKKDIIVIRLGPTDQILNVLMANARVALQLSVREGFEVKVSEALHHGVPIIATRAGGIPLQVKHEENGFLVEPGTPDEVGKEVAKRLFYLFNDDEAWERMAEYAAESVSDEVSTVGNALAWLYLADELSKGVKVEPAGQWVNDMARKKAGVDFDQSTETQLVRDTALDLGPSTWLREHEAKQSAEAMDLYE